MLRQIGTLMSTIYQKGVRAQSDWHAYVYYSKKVYMLREIGTLMSTIAKRMYMIREIGMLMSTIAKKCTCSERQARLCLL